MATTPVRTSLKWDVLVTNRQGLTRDLPPGKEKWMWVPTSATLNLWGTGRRPRRRLSYRRAGARSSGMGRGER